MSCNIDDASYEYRAKNSKKISLLTSHVPFLQGGGPYCLMVPTTDDSKEIILDRCSNTTNIWLKKPDGVTNISETAYQDSQFFYDRNSFQIKSVRDRNGCLYVGTNGKIKYTKTGCSAQDITQRFTIDETYHQIESKSEPGKCITATGFMDEVNGIYKSGARTNAVSRKELKLAECANKKYKNLTAFDPLADGMFIYEKDPPDVTSELYQSLADQYKTLIKLTAEETANIVRETNKALATMRNQVQFMVGVNEVSHQTIDQLQNNIMSKHKESFELINAQTDAIQAKIKNMKYVNNTDQKKNLYQLEQNKIIKSVHTILFWTYYVFAFIFLLIVGFAVGPQTFVFVFCLVISAVYPFVIIYIEYALVFLYYFLKALVIGKPFDLFKVNQVVSPKILLP